MKITDPEAVTILLNAGTLTRDPDDPFATRVTLVTGRWTIGGRDFCPLPSIKSSLYDENGDHWEPTLEDILAYDWEPYVKGRET